MTGIMMAVMNVVQPAEVVVPTPTLYLDAIDYSGSGTTWTAETGSNGTLVNAPAYTAPSPTYFSFNGTDETAYTPNLKASFASSNSMTLEIWARTASDNGVVITEQGSGPPFNLGYHLSIMEIVSGNLKVGLWQNPGSIGNVTVGAVTRDQWQQYVLTYDDATNTLTGYIDVATTASVSLENVPATPARIFALCQADTTNMGDGSFLAADVGLFRVWNSAFTAQQVQELYDENVDRFSNSVVTSNLVAYWDPNLVASYPGTGTTINNLTATSLPGTMSNITYTDPYFTYNGTSSTVSIADNAVLEPGSGDFTLEAWVYYSVITGSTRVIVGKTDGGNAADWGYGIRTTSVGAAYIEVGNGTTTVNSPAGSVTTGQWYQLVGVWTNVASNSIEFYINGVSQGSNSHSFASVKNTANPLYLGSFNNGQFAQWFNGRLGIVRYYSKALSSAEITQNFNANRDIYGV